MCLDECYDFCGFLGLLTPVESIFRDVWAVLCRARQQGGGMSVLGLCQLLTIYYFLKAVKSQV